MGFAGRTSHVKFAVKPRKGKLFKPLKIKIKTIGDAIRVSRQAKNLTPGQVAAKMGIAASLISAWEDGSDMPNAWQLKRLDEILKSSLAGVFATGTPSKMSVKMV